MGKTCFGGVVGLKGLFGVVPKRSVGEVAKVVEEDGVGLGGSPSMAEELRLVDDLLNILERCRALQVESFFL